MTQQQGALYLRVRPQAFDEILGNEAAIASLTAQLQKPDDKRSRVYFFTGPSGCGKNTLAYINNGVLVIFNFGPDSVVVPAGEVLVTTQHDLTVERELEHDQVVWIKL